MMNYFLFKNAFEEKYYVSEKLLEENAEIFTFPDEDLFKGGFFKEIDEMRETGKVVRSVNCHKESYNASLPVYILFQKFIKEIMLPIFYVIRVDNISALTGDYNKKPQKYQYNFILNGPIIYNIENCNLTYKHRLSWLNEKFSTLNNYCGVAIELDSDKDYFSMEEVKDLINASNSNRENIETEKIIEPETNKANNTNIDTFL